MRFFFAFVRIMYINSPLFSNFCHFVFNGDKNLCIV